MWKREKKKKKKKRTSFEKEKKVSNKKFCVGVTFEKVEKVNWAVLETLWIDHSHRINNCCLFQLPLDINPSLLPKPHYNPWSPCDFSFVLFNMNLLWWMHNLVVVSKIVGWDLSTSYLCFSSTDEVCARCDSLENIVLFYNFWHVLCI